MNKYINYNEMFDSIAIEIMNILINVRKNNQNLTKDVIKEYLLNNNRLKDLFNEDICKKDLNELKKELVQVILKVESILPADTVKEFRDKIEAANDICYLNEVFLEITNYFANYLLKVIGTFNKVWDVLKDTLKFMEVSNDKIFSILDSSKEIFIEEIKNSEKLDEHIETIEKETVLENNLDNLKKKLLEKLTNIKNNLKETCNQRKNQLKKLDTEVNKVKEDINRYKEQIQQLQDTIKQFKKEAIVDSLTNIYNRNYLERKYPEEFEKFKRYGQSLSVIMLDIDDFKKVNDNFGHQIGDNVLRYFATVIKNNIRKVDIPFRYGGEEFLILLPHTKLEQAMVVANRIHKELNDTMFKVKGLSLKVTASIGVTEARENDSMESLIKRVDDLLLKVKKEGKNRVLSG